MLNLALPQLRHSTKDGYMQLRINPSELNSALISQASIVEPSLLPTESIQSRKLAVRLRFELFFPLCCPLLILDFLAVSVLFCSFVSLQQPKLQVQPQRLHQQQPLLNGKEKEP
jgi:hypothetical protein